MDLTLIKAGGSCLESNLDNVAAKCLSLSQNKTLVVLGYSRLLRGICKNYQINRPSFISASGIESAFTNELVLSASLIACCFQLEMFRTALLKIKPELRIRTIVGADGLFYGSRKKNLKVKRGDKVFLFNDDRSGKINRVDKEFLIKEFTEADLVLVGPLLRGDNQELLVCDGDAASAHLAVELDLQNYTILSDIDGLVANGKVIDDVYLVDIAKLKSSASGGMTKKLYYVEWALRHGVREVCLSNGTIISGSSQTRFLAI